MQNIEQIVVPVDFHQHTNDLAAFAANIANKLGVKLIFLHVSEHIAEIVRYAEISPLAYTEVDKQIIEKANEKMEILVSNYKSNCPDCSGEVLRGDATDTIVDFVKNKNDCLIIMGTHGAKGIEKILIGSVAERVLKRASCPILVFNPYKGERGYQITSPISESVQPI